MSTAHIDKQTINQKLIDLRPMKARAIEFSEPVRTLILSEPDQLGLDEFLAKQSTWEKLLKMEGASNVRKQ